MKANLNAPTLAFQNLNQFYQKCSQENLQMGDVDQSIDQFLRMKGIEPNEQGTGRISFKDVKKIECLFIKEKRRGNTQKQYRSYFAKITDLLQAYLNIPATFIDNQLEIEKSSIEDPYRRLLYTLKRNKSRFDALQILDLLTEYKNEHNLLIAFVESSLHEDGGDVYGRACGNGVAVIDFNLVKGSQEEVVKFYQTLVHETLHTLGFDHCLSWACLMNPLVAGDLWPCPNCLVKLQSQLPVQLSKWAARLLGFYRKEVKWNKPLLRKSQKILDCLEKEKKQTEENE